MGGYAHSRLRELVFGGSGAAGLLGLGDDRLLACDRGHVLDRAVDLLAVLGREQKLLNSLESGESVSPLANVTPLPVEFSMTGSVPAAGATRTR